MEAAHGVHLWSVSGRERERLRVGEWVHVSSSNKQNYQTLTPSLKHSRGSAGARSVGFLNDNLFFPPPAAAMREANLMRFILKRWRLKAKSWEFEIGWCWFYETNLVDLLFHLLSWHKENGHKENGHKENRGKWKWERKQNGTEVNLSEYFVVKIQDT